MLRALLLSLALLLPGFAVAQDCARLAAEAGAEAGLPDGLLPAISLVEAGRGDGNGGIAPWPWTLNVAGESLHFPTRDAAHRSAVQYLSQGVTRIDFGLMQIHWAAHSDRLGTAWRALDPWFNLRVGAFVLRSCFEQRGSWLAAAGCYHAPRHTTFAARYRARFEDALASITGAP